MRDLRKVNLKGKRVLVRVDFNVFPLASSEPRIIKTIPTIKYLQSQGAKVILMTHLEANDGRIFSARNLAKYLCRYFPHLAFSSKIYGESVKKDIDKLKNGDVLLLENLRKDPREKSSSGRLQLAFAKKLAELGDIYVNEAFSASHRSHASIVVLPKLMPSYCGFLCRAEVDRLSEVFRPLHPFTLIVGGGKAELKIPILKSLVPKADTALLGGVLANVFFRKPLIHSKKIILPRDVLVYANGRSKFVDSNTLKGGEHIYDIGPKSLDEWARVIRRSRLAVWNGPLGFLEKGFEAGTKKLVSILMQAKTEVIIGGGDTLDFMPKRPPRHVFVSTGGGAMLEYLAKGTLPGLEALK